MTGELAELLQSYSKAEKVADREYVDRICSLVVHSKNIEKYLNNVMVVDNSFFKPGEKIKTSLRDGNVTSTVTSVED